MKKKITTAELVDGDQEKIYDINNDDMLNGCFGELTYIICSSPEEANQVVNGKLDYDDYSCELISRSDGGGNDILLEDDLQAIMKRKNSGCIVGKDCEGELFLIDDECYDFQAMLYYHDGNNWQIDAIENIQEEEIEEIEETTPEPAFYFSKIIKINDEEIEISTSNTSGALTPFWTESEEH